MYILSIKTIENFASSGNVFKKVRQKYRTRQYLIPGTPLWFDGIFYVLEKETVDRYWQNLTIQDSDTTASSIISTEIQSQR